VPADDVKLSTSMTVARYRALEQAGDRHALACFVRERFDERYFRPVEDSRSKHGFALMAIGCLVIEALESFYQGLADTRGKSAEMFRRFLNRGTPLRVFGGRNNWFYRDVRCGILHQAETRGGWRIRRAGALFDASTRTINASRFLRELRKQVEAYSNQLAQDDDCWKRFQIKMQAVCSNCASQAG